MDKKNNLIDKIRKFKLTWLAVDNSTSIFILTFMILLFGIQSYNSMPKEQMPEVSFPEIFINTPYFGNSAADIEALITRPIEKELKSLTGIKDVSSTSMQDFSVIIAEFEADMEMEDAVRKVKDAVDKAKSELPTDLEQDPEVLEINLAEIPIMTVNVSGPYQLDQLREYADVIKDELEEVKQISKIDMKGELEREMKIDVDMHKMQSLQVSFNDIEQAVSLENMNMSAGEIVNNDYRRAVRIIGELQSESDVENIIVKSENQRPILLKDIAEVKYGFQDRSSYARSDGFPVISLDVIKRKGQNLLDCSDNVKIVLDEVRNQLPDDVTIQIFNDQSVYTRTEVENLENSIISGVILVVLVLLFFLGLRNAMFVGIAIPLSMLTAIMWLHLSGTTMNIVVLFSLILALGLLVDNAIVVVENIYRFMQEGYDGITAAKLGTSEVALPIIASTATTLAAFVPLAFWPGIMGEFMYYMPLTLIVVLASSLFVALVINPVFTSRLMRVDERANEPAVRKRRRNNNLMVSGGMLFVALIAHFAGVEWLRNLLVIAALIGLFNFFVLRKLAFGFQNNFIPRLEAVYDWFIRGSLKRFNPYGIFLGTFVLLFLAIGALMIKSPKVIYFPAADPMYINAFVELPMGSDIEATNEIMKELEEKIESNFEKYGDVVEAVLAQIGENTSDPNSPPEPGLTPHKARLTVSFVPARDRGEISTWDILEEMRTLVKGYPGVKIVVDKNADGPPTGKPINLELRGEDIDKLATLSEQVISYLNSQNIAGIEELIPDVKLGKPELLIDIDRDAARRFETSTVSIASDLRTAIYGKEVSKFKDGEEEHPITLRLSDDYRNNISDVLNQKITFRNPANGRIVQVPVSAVADFEYSSSYSSIKRKNLDRMITIYSNVLEGYNANEIVEELQLAMEDFPLPEGFTYEFTGEQQQQQEDMGFLSTAFLVALFCIFIIIVTQFNSLVTPFIIILSVLFSTIGVFLGYAATGMDLVVIGTGVGIISLAGVVVNNAIVLIDYINLLMKRKMDERGLDSIFDMELSEVKEAIIKGGATRLRPVLLTAITTVLGLIPLAIGFNFNFFTLISELDPHIFIGG
ncbi:MAG: efflux RND transporter permease subunit, partial [Saprospiraceae bacterium]|nr:efflux RND transporter permease subunit [Saprospiraceae bacterium]